MSLRDIFENSPFGRGEGQRPKMPALKMKKSVWILFGLVLLLAIVIPATATFYTDMLWFRARGLSQVFWTRLIPQWILFAIATLIAFAIFSVNWLKARRAAVRELAASAPEGVEIPLKASAIFVLLISGVMAVMNGLGVRSEWMTVLQFLNRTPFGKVEPIFGKEVAFYVFDIPFLSLMQSWLLGTMVTALLGVGIIFFMAALPKMREENRFYLPGHARAHLSIIGAITVLVWGSGFFRSPSA